MMTKGDYSVEPVRTGGDPRFQKCETMLYRGQVRVLDRLVWADGTVEVRATVSGCEHFGLSRSTRTVDESMWTERA